MKLSVFLLATVLTTCLNSEAQKDYNGFLRYYPIGDDPNIMYKTSYRKEETILFEANPTVRFSVYNNFVGGLMNGDKHTQAWYVSFRPQLRMYTDNSLPVRMPSYRILLGTQHLFKTAKNHLWGFSLESGHYSNGQDGSAFSALYADGSPQSDSIYRTITPTTDLSKLLNRRSGNFSTNLTELIFTYRFNMYDDDDVPYKVHALKTGLTYYHDRFLGIGDFGGFADQDIELYGRYRWLLGYQFDYIFKEGVGRRLSVIENIELISGAHPWVNPFRSETTVTYYPFQKVPEIGLFITYVHGHDNYNFRFVDAGNQLAIGVSWSQFPPFQVGR